MGRHVGVDAFQADLVDAALGQCGEDGFVLPPFIAQGAFPVGIGLNAVAVADMHGRGAGQALGGAFQCLHAPFGGLLHIDVEGGFIKLDDVHPIGLQGQCFLVEQLGKGEGHFDFVAIEAVGHRIDDGHGARQGEFELFLGMGAGQLGFKSVHPAFEAQRGHHLRHHRVVAVVADAHRDFVLKVDAFDLLQKAMHKVLTRLLAIAHDVQACIFLGLDPQQGGIGLGLQQRIALGFPLGPKFVGFGQPGGFGQAAGDGGCKHAGDSFHTNKKPCALAAGGAALRTDWVARMVEGYVSERKWFYFTNL